MHVVCRISFHRRQLLLFLLLLLLLLRLLLLLLQLLLRRVLLLLCLLLLRLVLFCGRFCLLSLFKAVPSCPPSLLHQGCGFAVPRGLPGLF